MRETSELNAKGKHTPEGKHTIQTQVVRVRRMYPAAQIERRLANHACTTFIRIHSPPAVATRSLAV